MDYMNQLNLIGVRLVVYDACLTASGDENLCTATLASGAECVIGWSKSTFAYDAPKWMANFWAKVLEGYTIRQAAEYANDEVDRSLAEYEGTEIDEYVRPNSMKSWIIYGNGDLILFPQ